MSFQEYRVCSNCRTTDYEGRSPFCCGFCGLPFHSHSHGQVSSSSSSSSSSRLPASIASTSSPFSGFSSDCKKQPGSESEGCGPVDEVAEDFVEEVANCETCKKGFNAKKDVYALEFCRHGFCRTCLVGHVARHVQLSLQQPCQLATIEGAFEGVPCPVCMRAMSRQDIRMVAGAKTLALFDGFIVDLITRHFSGLLKNSCTNCASTTQNATLLKAKNLPELTSMQIREALMARNLPFCGSKTSCLQRLQTAVTTYSDSLSFCLSCDFIQCENCGDVVKDHPKSASSASPSTHECPPMIKLLRSLFCCMVKLEKVANKSEAEKVVPTTTNTSNKASISTTSKRKLTGVVDWLEKAKDKKMSAESKLPKPGKDTKSTQFPSYPTPTPNLNLHHPFGHIIAPPQYSQPLKISTSPIPACNHSLGMPMHFNSDWCSHTPTQTYEEDEDDLEDAQVIEDEYFGYNERYMGYPSGENSAGNAMPGMNDNSTFNYTAASPPYWFHRTMPQMFQKWPQKEGKKNEATSSKAQILAVNSEKAADVEMKQIFEQLIEIVGLFPPDPERLPSPVVALICSHKAAMRVMGELVRNDSILDVSTRSMLYFELFSLLQAFASRKELLPFLCHPCFSNNSTDDAWVKKKHWKFAGSIAGDLRKLYRQMKGLLGKSSYLMACSDDVGSMEAALVAVGANTYEELKKAIQVWERTSRHIWCEDADDYFRRFGFGDSVLPDSLSRDFSDARDVELTLLTVGVPQSSNGPATKGGDLAKDVEFIYTPSPKDVEAYKNALHPLQHGFESLSESHYYRKKQNEGNWRVSSIRHVSKEIAVLLTNLPLEWESSIFVRFDNSRMDLLKVLIIGPQNTPYMNGVFLFDMWLSENYPDSPPSMQFLTTGGGSIRFNPNLYEDGKVCLSLLGTWDGPSWVGGQSTILQVLISIQSLVFVANPYANEPGQELFTVENCPPAREYIETQQWNTLMYSILPALKNPEPVFKDVILTHFRLKREEIIRQCAKWVEVSLRNVCVTEKIQKELRKL